MLMEQIERRSESRPRNAASAGGFWLIGAVSIQALVLLPLANSYAGSEIPLLIGVGFMALLDVLIFRMAAPDTHWFLQTLALASTAAGLLVVLNPEWIRSPSAETFVVSICCALLPAAAWRRLPNRAVRWALVAQQLGVLVTLLGWQVVDFLRHAPSFDELISHSSFHHGMRVFQAAPLLLASTLAAALLLRSKAFWIFISAICAGQYGIGCMELGNAARRSTITYLGVALGLSMLPMLFVAWRLDRAEHVARR